MSLKTIWGAHHTSPHFIIYLFSCDKILERAHARTNTHTTAAFIQLTEMMVATGATFFPPAGSDRGQRSSIHHGQIRAHPQPPHPRAQMGAECSAWKAAHTYSAPFRLFICWLGSAKHGSYCYRTVLLLCTISAFRVVHTRREHGSVRPCALAKMSERSRLSSSSTASLSILWAHITSWAPNLLPQPPLELVLRTVDPQSITHWENQPTASRWFDSEVSKLTRTCLRVWRNTIKVWLCNYR